jgi:hypothetical protein
LIFILYDSDVSIAYPLTFLERVDLIFQCILVLAELDLRRDQSIEGQLRLIYEFCGYLVYARVYLEWGLWFQVGWLDNARGLLLLGRDLRLPRVQIRIILLHTWGRTTQVRIVRWLLLLLWRHPTKWLLWELPSKSCWGPWQVWICGRPAIWILTWHLIWQRCSLLWGKEALSCAIHHGSLKPLLRGWVIGDNRLDKAHHFSQIRLLLRPLRACPIA